MSKHQDQIYGLRFVLRLAPIFFNVLKWTVLLGILKAISLKSEVAYWSYYIGLIILANYTSAISLRTIVNNKSSNPGLFSILIVFLALLIAYGINEFIMALISDLSILG